MASSRSVCGPPKPNSTRGRFPARPGGTRDPVAVTSAALSSEEQANWVRLGIRAAYLIPVLASAGCLCGLIVVTFRTRWSISGVMPRAYRNVAAHAATALENMLAGIEMGALKERQRVAQDIHRGLAQTFSGIVMHESLTNDRAPEENRQAVQLALLAAREAGKTLDNTFGLKTAPARRPRTAGCARAPSHFLEP